MRTLHGQMRHYAWGSHTFLAELTGRPSPSAEPEAELWYGAHPAEPCRLGAGSAGEDENASLADLIASDPEGQLGERCAERWGAELPFLLKLLAAGEPLSLQAHPSAEQAQAGFAKENALGIALDDPKRNYKDPRHKPELLVALTEFEALAGFATLDRIGAFLEELEVVEAPAEDSRLRRTVKAWTGLAPAEAAAKVAWLGEAAARVAKAEGEFAAHAEVIADLAARYPRDPGVLIATLLNHVALEPGQGLFIPAGVLHAHVRGLGVEVMANSDNVLRGGLTSKHVDVDELLPVVDFTASGAGQLVVEGARVGSRREFRTPADEFALSSFRLAREGEQVLEPPATGPRILLCTAGSVRVQARGQTRLVPGEAGWLAASDVQALLTAEAPGTEMFWARVP